MKKRVYISGRISDLPREQYMTMFGIAEQMLRKKGYKPVNPTRFLMCRWPWLYRLLGYNVTLLIVAAVERSQHRELRSVPHEDMAHVERRGAEDRQAHGEANH